jgi:hypothetical protein
MANQLAMAGGQSQKNKARKYAPIWVNRFISGYWPNRNPLRDAALPVLQEKFYGSLNDALIDGLNCELNTKSELARRFGNSVYNTNTANAQQRFYSFPVFGNNSTASYQRVLSSSATQITDITNNGDSLVYFKPSGAQKTVFQAIGDTCFFSDTVAPKQLLSSVYSWTASTSYTPGIFITDTNNNLQKNLGIAVVITFVSVAITASGPTLEITYTGTSTILPGMTVYFTGLQTATWLNGTSCVVTGISAGSFVAPINAPAYANTADSGVAYSSTPAVAVQDLNNAVLTSNVLTLQVREKFGYTGLITVGTVLNISGIVNPNYLFLNGTTLTVSSITYTLTINVSGTYTHANVSQQGISGGQVSYNVTTNVSGSSQPAWLSTYQGITIDNGTAWLYSGPAVRNVGITAPTAPPVVANTPAAPQGSAWVASTYYFPSQVMFDPVTSSLQQLTQAGTTNATVPSFSATAGVSTTDGTAHWVSLGTATRSTNAAYTVNQYIMATWNKTVITGYSMPNFKQVDYTQNVRGAPIYSTVSYSAFYQCTTAGTTSTTATGSISWPLSGNYTDGTAIWTFTGLEVTRTSSASASPSVNSTTFTPGNITNSELVSLAGSLTTTYSLSAPINDGTNFEIVTVAGKSGSSAPTWSTTTGGSTTDNGINWTNGGSSGTLANTGSWFYAYAYLSSTTPDVSSASTIAAPVTRGANSWISISGLTSTDPQVDTIRIYRSLQQVASVTQVTGSELFWIADIPMPSALTWDFVDSSNDPPNAGATMNTFIIADTVGTNAPAPAAITNFVYYLGRLWGSIGNTVYASAGPDVLNGGNPFTAFPAVNFMDFPATVVRMVASSQGLMVYTSNGVQVITGTGISGIAGVSGFTTFVPVSYADNISLGGYDCLAVDGATTYIYTVDRNLVSLSSSGLSWISTAIANKLKSSFTLPDGTVVNFTPSTSYLTWYVNGDDYGLFISDGSYGWFRMMPSTSPDAGNMVWSPFAEISGGVSAVQSIETTIGVHNLLIGPGVSGNILKRDFTVNTDNGTTFSWYATFGSIVLAHPGEVALIQAITVDSVFTGSHPSIIVYFDEISNSTTAISHTYTDYVSDPYNTPQSNTVYADRFYMSDEPSAVAVCRHLQITIQFPAEDAANTVLSNTIIGATEYDFS